ncbi:putative TIR domain, AAA+ ATPase domain, P-loop containing nucleoside triphosphate hydrolase [Helianthus annuus]|nr:putative TIR domain, AAA+ ATPase domain, P-loop containing nucleoside triphosphate hydrolase [Helianthus annuus]
MMYFSVLEEKTRKTFVDHFYSALVDRQICTYKDDETLSRGESIGPSLFKAIQESRIAVIIFSKNYTNSSWCLDELAYIMQCRDERGLIVMPVFYDVDPSELRKQKKDFGKAFAKQNTTKVESWRKALVDASEIAGWEPKNIANGHESQVIINIVDSIFSRLLPLNSDVHEELNEELIGMRARLQDFATLLDVGSDGVRMVGIWGVGGSGKTTLATSLYMEISKHFHGHCTVENIREESSKFGLKKLQEDLLSRVFKTEVKVQSVTEGKRMIRKMISSRKVLVILDDVDKLSQLDALAGSHDWFSCGSRIIITTRDEHLLKTHRVNNVCHVRLLSQDESIMLFKRHAYNVKDPVEDYKTLSLHVVSYAAGRASIGT